MSTNQKLKGMVFSQIFSGAGIGLLVGVIVGLSVSPVVKTILGALAGLLAAFLGLQENFYSKQSEEDASKIFSRIKNASIRAGSFGFACVFGILLGITLRTHDALTISIKSQVQNWVDAGYDTNFARSLVVYQKFKFLPDSVGLKVTPISSEAANTMDQYGGFLFSKEDMQNYCVSLSMSKYNDSVEYTLEAYDGMKHEIKNLAANIRKVPEQSQAEIINSIVDLICYLGNSDFKLENFCQSIKAGIDYQNIEQTLNHFTNSEHQQLAMLANNILMSVSDNEIKTSLFKSIMEVICPAK